MGFDVSYHPINELEMEQWYFDRFEDVADENYGAAQRIAEDAGLDDFYKGKYIDTLRIGVDTEPDDSFDKSHAYYVAVIQGFFRSYFYIRGGAFSFLLNEKPKYAVYTKPWQQILKHNYENPIHNRITENYSAGVYLPFEQVERLYNDYHNDAQVKEDVEKFFSHGRLTIFLQAIDYCRAHKLGMLEATEVIEPNPTDLNASACYSNLYNCDVAGPMLYRETAMAQIANIEQQERLAPRTVSGSASYQTINGTTPQPPKEKKSFWKRIFG